MTPIMTIELLTKLVQLQEQDLQDLTGRVQALEIIVKALVIIVVFLAAIYLWKGL